MLKKIMIIFIVIQIFNIFCDEKKYPIIYIPGMFDNGNDLTKDNLLVKDCNDKDGFYYQNYFNETYNYEKEELLCSSNIVGGKYQRFIVANSIGNYRTNIALDLMAQRLFCLLEGKAPKNKNYTILTNHKGNDYSGFCKRDGKEIYFQGLIEEVFAKYGKKVYYKNGQGKKRVVLEPKENDTNISFYENKDGYFLDYKEIKFNFITHSSGGLALREYIRLLKKEGKNIPINLIVNLSVPQQGARLTLNLKRGFSRLIEEAIKSFAKKEDGFVNIEKDGQVIQYSYKDLMKKTRVEMMFGDNISAKIIREILGGYIYYFIPFDGRERVLGTDPALYDLNPTHNFIKKLNKEEIPEDIKIYNFRVKHPYAKMFASIGKYVELDLNDGAVDYRDTSLENIPNFSKLKIKNIDVEQANHIPMPYIKPLFELRETVEKFYPVLSLLLKEKESKEDGVSIVQALISSITLEFGLDLKKFMKEENYSVIDYFAEHPVNFE